MTLFIHAPNVHQGGGRALLSALLANLDQTARCVLDQRMQTNEFPLGPAIRLIKPRLINRFEAEVFLRRNAKSGDKVLCFGNLPPLFKSQANVLVFLQNRYMFGKHDFSRFALGARIRLMLERWWFRNRMQSGYQIIVQSPTMQRELKNTLGFESIVVPFIATKNKVTLGSDSKASGFDFVYVSSAEPHKNHATLLDAWVMLAEQGVRPSLALTVSEESAAHIAQLIEQKKVLHGLNISNLGTLKHEEVQALYGKSKALIFPSKLESFGLPLLEAGQHGLPVLAPELDYVRDVIEPNQTFDPDSPVSMARAVLRHLNISTPKTELLEAREFLARIEQMGRP